MSFDWLVAAIGWVLTVGVELIPGLKAKWDGVPGLLKWIIVMALFLVLGYGSVGLRCLGISIRPDLFCPTTALEWGEVFRNAIFAWAGSQFFHNFLSKPAVAAFSN